MTMQVGVNSKGGYLQQPYLSKDVFEQMLGSMRAQQLVTLVNGFGKNDGESVDFTIYSTLSEDATELNELELLKVTDMDVIRSSATVEEIGIAVAYTGKLEMLAELPVEDPIRREISKNMTKKLNSKAVEELRAGQYYYTPTGTVGNESYTLSSTGAATVAATARGMQVFDTDAVVEEMFQNLYVPTWDNDNFIAYGSHSSVLNLMQDDNFRAPAEMMKHTPKLAQAAMNNELMTFGNLRFLKDTQEMKQYIQTAGGTDNAAGAKGDYVFCGQDCLSEARVVGVDIRSDSWNFNRINGLAALYYGVFKNVLSAQTAAGLIRTVNVGSLT